MVVVGSYAAISGKDSKQVRLDVRIQDTRTGETIAEDAVSGREDELFEIVSRAGADLRNSLGVYRLRPEDASMVTARPCPTTMSRSDFILKATQNCGLSTSSEPAKT